MSVLWADNFQTYGTDENNLLDGIYAQINNSLGGTISLADDPDPNADGDSKVIRFGTGLTHAAATTFRFVLPGGALTTVGSSLRMWSVGLPDSAAEEFEIFRWSDINNSELFTLVQRSTGQITLNQSGVGDVATSTLPVLTANAFNHIEAKLTIGDGTGAFECRVDGIEVAGLTLSSQSFGTTQISQLSCRRPATGASVIVPPQINIKDLVVWDTNGSVNNDFIGSCQVYTLQVDGDSSVPWDKSSGTEGYSLIDELTPDDADYIEADATPPAEAIFTFEDVPDDVVSVKALLPVYRARKTDGGEAQLQSGLNSGASTDTGADRPITSSFAYWWDVSEVNPVSGVEWTPNEVDAATVQIDRTV